MDAPDDLIDKMGEHIEILNNKYDIHWKIILPEKKIPNGSDIFNDYVRGYNDCIDDLLGVKHE